MKHKLITLVLAVAVIASLVLTGCAKPVAPPVAPPVTPPEEPAPEPEEKPALPTRILFGSSAGVTSSWYPMYVKIAELTNKGLDAHVTMVLPGGSAASLQAVYAGDSDVGVTNVAAMYQAVQGLGAWEGNPQPNCMRAFYHCSKYTLCIVVRADSDMFDIGDLAGKHVYLGRPGSSSHVFMHITLSANDIEVGEERDKLTIAGGEPRGAAVDSWNDHRIAMAFGVLGSVTDKTVISNAGCVSKSFPQFWDVVNSVGGKVRIDGE